MLRENKRQLDRAIRDLDRERMALQQQEKKTVAEIKKMAKEGQMVRITRRLTAWSYKARTHVFTGPVRTTRLDAPEAFSFLSILQDSTTALKSYP